MLDFKNYIINKNSFHQNFFKSIITNFPEELIREGLIKSVEYDVIEKLLKKLLKRYNKTAKIEIDHNGVFLIFGKHFFNTQMFDDFLNLLNITGYYIPYHFIDGIKSEKRLTKTDIFSDYNYLQLTMVKRYDIESDGIPEYLYHITDVEYLKRIKKNGLIPKAKNKIEFHLDRIYVVDTYDGALDVQNIFNREYEKNNWVILKINTKLLNKIKLYHDPTFFEKKADDNYKVYYTYDNIPNFSIELL